MVVSWVGEAGRGYHCESDLAGLGVTVPLCFRSELFLKQNITRQCLEEMKSAQNLNLPVSHCIGPFHNKALVFHGRYPRSRRAQGTRKGPGSRVGVSGRHPQRCWGSLQAELSQFGAFPPYPRTAGIWTFFGETGRWTNNKTFPPALERMSKQRQAGLKGLVLGAVWVWGLWEPPAAPGKLPNPILG